MNYATASYGAGSMPERIRKTFANTFITVGGMWAVTSVSAYASLGLTLGLGMTLGLFVMSLLVLFGAMAFRNSGFGLVLVAAFSALQGMTLGPVLNHYLSMQGGAQMVVTAAGMTAAATFGCAMYAMTARRSFSRWGSFLFAALIVLLVGMVVELFFPSTLLKTVISAVACLVFTAYMLMDLSSVATGEEDNYIVASINVYLNMLNLFMHLLRLLSIFGSSDD